MKKIIIQGLISIVIVSNIAMAGVSDIANFDFNPKNEGFKYRPLQDFNKLSSFKSIKDFETYYKKYIQKCLDNTFGGTGGIPCLVESEIWDRELNIVYKKLYAKLDTANKKTLKKAQKLWINECDLNLELIGYIEQEGTMYRLINAGIQDEAETQMIKQRTVFLRMILGQLEEKQEMEIE